MKEKVLADTVHLRELYLTGKPGTWEVRRGATAYYPIAIACGSEHVISFHSWDGAAARKAAALVELHNAIPDLLRVAETVKGAWPNVKASDCALVPVKLQELSLFLADLPKGPWSVRPQSRLSPTAVVSDLSATVADFTSFEPWAAAVSALLVVMYESLPNLLEIASAIAALDSPKQGSVVLAAGTRFKLAVPLRVYAEGGAPGGKQSEAPAATETDIAKGTELEILGPGTPRAGDDQVSYTVKALGSGNKQFELAHSALASLGYLPVERRDLTVAA